MGDSRYVVHNDIRGYYTGTRGDISSMWSQHLCNAWGYTQLKLAQAVVSCFSGKYGRCKVIEVAKEDIYG